MNGPGSGARGVARGGGSSKGGSHGSPNGNARTKLVALAALFMLPVIAAMVLYRMDWRPSGTTNHGELIQPARPIADVPLQTWDGKPVNFSAVTQKWTMLYFASAECGGACEQALYKMRQVHLAQGRERDRLQRILIVTDARARDWLNYTLKEYRDMTVLTGSPQNLTALMQQFTPAADVNARAATAPLTDGIYILDPLDNYMLRYRSDADPSGMRKDLKNLLKLSQIG